MENFVKIIIRWLQSAAILRRPRKYLGRILADYYYPNIGMMLIPVHNPEATNFFDLIRQIKKETTMLLADQEAYQIYNLVKKVEKISGDVAEVGVYAGGSAKLICEATNKRVHLFDTFEGLPKLSEYDNSNQFSEGAYSASLEDVKNYLRKYSQCLFYKGFFPETATSVENIKFSFVHLDVDIYQSTLDCLEFFYPKINSGGCMISHDYPVSVGVKKAFDEFFSDKPEIIIELPGCGQCLIVKI